MSNNLSVKPSWLQLQHNMMEVAVGTPKLHSNHTIDIPTPSFYRPDALPVTEPKVSNKALKAIGHLGK